MYPYCNQMQSSEKIPPQNIDAEASLLGAVLFDPDALIRVVEIVRPEHFYQDSHRKIFTVIFDLFDKGHPVDLVTLTEGLRASKELDAVGGVTYLSELTNKVSTSAHVTHYAKIIYEKYLLRSLITASSLIIEEACEEGCDSEEVLDKAENMIFNISGEKTDGTVASMKDLVKNSIATIDSLCQKKELVTGIPTGFMKMDEMTSGFHEAELIIIAGRPSMGKTAFALSLIEHMAVEHNYPVAFFSLEMSAQSLAQRMLCAHAKLNAQKVRTGFIGKNDWPTLTRAASRLSQAPIYIDDSPGLTAFEIRAKARRLKSKFDIKCIMIDYLQLMQGKGRTESRQQEISEISRRLKALAREINVPVISLSQLSRAVESRPDKMPMLSDLRESGSIEQDADLVLLLYREEYYNPTEENKNMATVKIAKQRNGPVGDVNLMFRKELARFENMSLREDNNSYN